MKKVVILSGAGISAESGLKTFRDSDGLWENYRIEDVATPQAWKKDRNLVLQFYNERRKQVIAASPNSAHLALAQLEAKFDVHIITQNIDDLHERAGSKKVLHLHGEILKARSTMNEHLIYPVAGDSISEGDTCELGSQLRPHIVWFGELVPALEDAARIVSMADILIVVGTSLAVYPAAGLINFASSETEKFLVNPDLNAGGLAGFKFINANAGSGIPDLVNELINR